MATAATGRGHMTRSSISRVMPNSCASGRATAAIPLNIIATAIRPGSRTVLKFMPAIAAVGFIAAPPLMCGMIKVKTNRNSSGFMQTRITKGRSSRRKTCRSRKKSPAKARPYCINFEVSVLRLICGWKVSSSASWVIGSRLCKSLLAKVSASKPDKDCLEAGFGDRQVAKAVRVCLTNNIGQQALGAVSEESNPVGRRLHTGDAREMPELFDQSRDILPAAQVELIELLCSH